MGSRGVPYRPPAPVTHEPSHLKLPETHSHAKAGPALFYQTYLHDCCGGRSGHSRQRGRHLQADGAQARPRSRWPPLCTLRGSAHAVSAACRQADMPGFPRLQSMQGSPAFRACRDSPASSSCRLPLPSGHALHVAGRGCHRRQHSNPKMGFSVPCMTDSPGAPSARRASAPPEAPTSGSQRGPARRARYPHLAA